jgi:NADPH2:quinone reductase
MPDSLVIEEIPSLKARAGELVVEVKAAGVNFPDVLMIQNKYQHRPQLPFSPGYEIVGVVKEVGAGGVGLAAVQIGKLMGAKIIACASSIQKLEFCKRHGADELVNYDAGDFREQLSSLCAEGVDVALDPVGGTYTERVVRSMASGGRHLVVGFSSGEIPKLPLNLVLLKSCTILGVAWDSYSRREPQGCRSNIAQLLVWIAEGKLKPALTAEYPLERAAQALEDVMHRRVQGKVIVVP